MRRQHARWLVALWVFGGLALLAIMAIVILPPLLSADYHRAAIEALASRLTGRQVIIKGPIRLSMVPDPQLSAGDIRIDVPHGERISAASLRLDLAPRALLLGRLRATRLTLHMPRIVVPWPLPDGAASILPPPWLASLHAKVENGTIILGGLVFEHADLSIFTGGKNGVLAASGTGTIYGMPVTASLNLAGANSHGVAPVIASIATPVSTLARQKAGLSFSGTVNAKSLLTGRLAGSALPVMTQSVPLGHILPNAPVQFTARASASRRMITLTTMKLTAGAAELQGAAVLDLTTGMASLMVHGHDIDATPVLRLFDDGEQGGQQVGALNLRADLTGSRIDGFAFIRLRADIHSTGGGTIIRAFSAVLPGRGRLSLESAIDPRGLHGTFTLTDQAPAGLIKAAAGAVPALAGLPSLNGPLHLAGSVDVPVDARKRNITIRLGGLHGGLGGKNRPDATLSSGAIVARLAPAVKAQKSNSAVKARRLSVAASLGFAQLDATPLLRFIKASPLKTPEFRLDVALTARRARIGTAEARHLLLDARLAGGLTIRAFDFHAMTHGNKQTALVASRGNRSAAGTISHASLLIAGPDAAQAIALLPQDLALPKALRSKALLNTRFAAGLRASGPAAALASRAVVHLGTMRIKADSKIDLVNNTASGMVSFRMPDAIALMKPWDAQAGLAWPGAGSAGLRADFTTAPKHLGLSNFVLSFGALTASGRLALDYGAKPATLSGVVNADTLALPSVTELLPLANAPNRLALQLPDIRASHILLGGVDVADDVAARLTATPGAVTLGVNHASLAGGVLTGQAILHAAAGSAPPRLTANLKLDHADVAALKPAFAAARFPPVISAGRLTVNLNAQASGYTAKTWAATLGGTLDASGTQLTVQGIDLAAVTRRALLTGSTGFATMALTGGFTNGAFAIGKAKLDGTAGSVGVTGSVDLPDQSLAVTASLQPKGLPKSKIAFSGSWAHPKRLVTKAPARAAQLP